MKNIMEILDKLQFFGGQRAGRELWADKPTNVQDADIESFNENIEAIREYIQQLEARVPRWISVKERLPEEGQVVLFVPTMNQKSVYVGKLSRVGKQGGALFENMYSRTTMRYYATHWMPRPMPQKEETK